MSNEQFEQNAVAKRRKADADYEAVMDRPRGPGATFAAGVGHVLAGGADPINLASMTVAPEVSLGIMKNFLQWGAYGLGVGGAQELLQAPYQEEVHPGYLGSAALTNVVQGALFAGASGAAFRGVANVWDRIRTGAWPQSVKDAGNIISSQANINGSNVYPGIEGATAHPQALSKSTDDILHGRPVDVSDHITPELEARAEVPITTPPVIRPGELLLEPTSAQQQTEAQIRFMAWRAGYDMPTEEAVRISDRLAKATPDEAQKIMRDLQMSPRQVADAPTHIEPIPEPLPVLVSPIEDIHAPDLQAAVRADLDRELIAPQEGQYPTAVDVDGNISYQSIDKALNEVDGYKTAADQIAACASPAPEAEAA